MRRLSCGPSSTQFLCLQYPPPSSEIACCPFCLSVSPYMTFRARSVFFNPFVVRVQFRNKRGTQITRFTNYVRPKPKTMNHVVAKPRYACCVIQPRRLTAVSHIDCLLLHHGTCRSFLVSITTFHPLHTSNVYLAPIFEASVWSSDPRRSGGALPIPISYPQNVLCSSLFVFNARAYQTPTVVSQA